jgi:hypothetical protein
MQVYEFNVNNVSDEIIQTPEQYKNNHKKFSAMKLKTKGFKFNREKANER